MSAGSTRIITAKDISRIVASVGLDALMDDMIARLITACEEHDPETMPVRERDGFHYTEPEIGLMEWMPAMRLGQHTTLKMVGYHPENPARRQLPTIIATIGAYDAVTGHMIALTDGTFATALRTGAASGVASRYLARPDSRVMGIIGCGAQAITQLHAMLRCFDLEQVLYYDADPATAASFPQRVESHFGKVLELRPAAVDLMVQSVDILCTSTSLPPGEPPLFNDVEPRPWCHINAVGSDFRGKNEIPKGLLERALVVPDHLEQCRREGECQHLPPEKIGPSLPEIVANAEQYQNAREGLTVFDSTGWALEDHIVVEMLLEYAERLGIGTEVQLELVPDDPLDPYDIPSADAADAVDPRRMDI